MKKFVRLKDEVKSTSTEGAIILARDSDNPRVVVMHQGDNHIKVNINDVLAFCSQLQGIAKSTLE